MGMTFKNLCNSCTNIGCVPQSCIVNTECPFYMPPHLEPDNCGNYVVMQPTKALTTAAQQASILEQVGRKAYAEAYDSFKKDYENRLKTDMIAILEDLNLEIDEMFTKEINYTVDKIQDLIQEKINKLKGE